MSVNDASRTVIDASRVSIEIVVSQTLMTRGALYDGNMLIAQALMYLMLQTNKVECLFLASV